MIRAVRRRRAVASRVPRLVAAPRFPRWREPTALRRRSGRRARPGVTVVQREQRARVAGRDARPAATRRCTGIGRLSSRMVLLTWDRLRPIRQREFLVGHAELLEQLLVGRRLLERVELRAVHVLQQRIAQHGVVGGVSHDRRDACQPRGDGRPQPALAHHQLVAAVGPSRRTTTGCRTPNSRIEWVSSPSASSSKTCRGCLGWRGSRDRRARRSRAPATGRSARGSVVRLGRGTPRSAATASSAGVRASSRRPRAVELGIASGSARRPIGRRPPAAGRCGSTRSIRGPDRPALRPAVLMHCLLTRRAPRSRARPAGSSMAPREPAS